VGLFWGAVMVVAAVVGDRAWCLGADAVNWGESCAHRVLPEQPPLFEIAAVGVIVPMALWRAYRRSRGLDRRWDWLRWGAGDGETP
jgi:hypothetical protein